MIQSDITTASGDFRNVVKTLASLPRTYTGDLLFAINDLDMDIVARNVIMLLLALMVEDPEQAVQTIVHIWYSADIRPLDAKLLAELIHPMIASKSQTMPPSHCKRRLGKSANTLYA